MNNCKRIFTLGLCLLLSGCTTTNKQKRLIMTGSGAVIGGVVGNARPEEPTKNAVMYGSLFGLGAAVVSEFVFDDEKVQKRLKLEADRLKRENEVLRKDAEPKLQNEGSNLLQAPIPNDVRKLVSPGNWRRFKIDRWAHDEDNENQWIRQTEIFEITPPGSSNR